jgi:tryptophan synthase alpha chain
LAATFAALKARGRVGLVTYVTAGDPSLARSAEILAALPTAGADVLEVGVPFSDPLADGPVIQRASERALAAGATLTTVLDLIARTRPDIAAPVVVFTYANPVLRMGVETFVRRAAEAGVDGVLVLDYPIEEARAFRDLLAGAGLDMIFLLSPTTTDERIRLAETLGSGFLYGISRLGVTGVRDTVAEGAAEMAARIRAQTELPLALGFGISKPEHVAQVGRWADAAVVGSGLVQVIAAAGKSADVADKVQAYVRWLRGEGPPPGAAGNGGRT